MINKNLFHSILSIIRNDKSTYLSTFFKLFKTVGKAYWQMVYIDWALFDMELLFSTYRQVGSKSDFYGIGPYFLRHKDIRVMRGALFKHFK